MERWIDEFSDAIEAGQARLAIEVLNARSTQHASTPNSADKKAALTIIRKTISNPQVRYQLATQFAGEQAPVGAELAASIVSWDCDSLSGEPIQLLRRLADHASWEVRETVAAAAGSLLEHCWDTAYPICADWSRDSSAMVRRAVAVAAKYAAKARNPSWAKPLLTLLEPLLADSDPYVRKNLGPFAVGDGLLRCYPSETLAWLAEVATRQDESTRWNVAMAFSTAEAAKHVDEALRVLELLSSDPRSSVKRAVASALKKLANRTPVEVRASTQS